MPSSNLFMNHLTLPNHLLLRLSDSKAMRLKGGIYHLTQVKLCYNSNRIEVKNE